MTDGRFFRCKGIPVYGMGGVGGGGIHSHNEYIDETEFLMGIEKYKTYIKTFSSVPFDQ